MVVDGLAIQQSQKIYLMMNKPRGLVTTTSDEKGRTTIYDLLDEESLPWVAPVGRLDMASEGLLLLTNDSEWGARVAAPQTHIEKIYHVQIGGLADPDFIEKLLRGVRSNGDLLRAREARLLRSGQKNCWIEIVLDEGKNRQIRRMMEALSVEVLRLVRVAIGPQQLGTLAKGAFRELSAAEMIALNRAMQTKKR